MPSASTGDLHQTIHLLWTFDVPWHWAYPVEIEPWKAQFAFGLYGIMLTSQIVGVLLTIFYRPRTWCVFCPMGNMTQLICKLKARYLWGGQHRDPDKDSGWKWRLHHHPRDAPPFSEWGAAQKCEKDRGRLSVAEAHINLYQRGLHPWAYAEYPSRYPQNVYSGRDDGRRHQEIRHQAVGLGAKKPGCISHQGFPASFSSNIL